MIRSLTRGLHQQAESRGEKSEVNIDRGMLASEGKTFFSPSSSLSRPNGERDANPRRKSGK